ncbi:MAG: ABC transporter substrate-binding protein [Frankia sp.]|nr:ABC transporter substrate-binding protein [Frankia sp.]
MLWSDRETRRKRRRDDAVAARPDAATSAAAVPAAPAAPAAASPTDTVAGDESASGLQVVSAGQGFRIVDRRRLLRLAGTAALAAPASGLLAACSGGGSSGSSQRAVRIGVVTPQTGALSRFADADLFVVDAMRRHLTVGLPVGDRTYPVEIYYRDSQSSSSGAAEATTRLIYQDRVDIVLASGTTDTTVLVADQCEANGIPCITTLAPWESWFLERGGSIEAPFTWTYHFSPGFAEIAAAYTSLWSGPIQTNKIVGVLAPDDIDGRYLMNPQLSFRGALAQNGFRLVNPQLSQAQDENDIRPYLFRPGEKDFTPLVEAFRDGGVQIVTGIPRYADFLEFRKKAEELGFQPPFITLSKALMFSIDIRSLGAWANGSTTEVFWSPKHPGRSFLTNQTSEDLKNEYVDASGSWSQQVAASHALFEVAAQALAAVSSLDDRRAIADAIGTVSARTIVGQLKFGANGMLPKNVAVLPVVGGQWQVVADADADLYVVNNNLGDPNIPTAEGIRLIRVGTPVNPAP